MVLGTRASSLQASAQKTVSPARRTWRAGAQAAFDAEHHVGLEPECLIGARDLGAMAVVADCPLAGDRP